MDYSNYYSDYYADYYSDYGSSAISSSTSSTILAALGAFVMIFMIIGLVIAVLQIIGMWKTFSKAGEEGWKSLIPVYNIITLFKISGVSPWWVFGYLAAIVPIIGWMAVLALNIYQSIMLSKSFGKSGGFAAGLILLPPIFYMILGFGDAKYIVPGGNKA